MVALCCCARKRDECAVNAVNGSRLDLTMARWSLPSMCFLVSLVFWGVVDVLGGGLSLGFEGSRPCFFMSW